MIIQISLMLRHYELSVLIAKPQDCSNGNVSFSLSISCAGLNEFQLDMIDATKNDSHAMNVIVLPVALLVLRVVIRINFPLVISSIIMIGGTVST